MDVSRLANGRKVERDFEAEGFRCIVTFDDKRMFHRCGYIVLPPEHPYADGGRGYMVTVHGGVTYSEPGDDGEWVLGFDCAHAGDRPDIERAKEALDGEELEFFMEYAKACCGVFDPVTDELVGFVKHMWTADDVEGELRALASEMRAVMDDAS